MSSWLFPLFIVGATASIIWHTHRMDILENRIKALEDRSKDHP